MNIPRFAVKYPITVSMLFLGIILMGVISMSNLGTDLLPDIASPKVVIRLESGEKPPEEMERKYAKNIESVISMINNVKSVRSTSLTGETVITAEFSWDTDMDFALLDVQKAVASYAGDSEVDNISIDRYDPRSAPIVTISVLPKLNQTLDELLSDTDKIIRRRLERIDGVAAAVLTGGREKEVVVRMKPYHLLAYELTPQNIINKIRESNVNQSGGRVEDNEKVYIIKGIGEFQELNDLSELVVGYKTQNVSSSSNSGQGNSGEGSGSSSGNGEGSSGGGRTVQVPVFLKDVADVEFIDKEVNSIVRYNGVEGIGISIYRDAQSNTVTTANLIKEEIEKLKNDLKGLDIIEAKNQAGFITAAIDEVEFAAIFGILLAIIILSVFLRNVWSTIIVAISIPISIIATFNLMYYYDLTLNMMTLGGLALGAGMLVDNSIVVMENIFRHLKKGKSPKDAAADGTSEVGVAILASTITTIIVFMPIIYVKGVGAELFKDQAFTVVFSLLSSLVVAFLLIPAFSAKFIKLKKKDIVEESKIRNKFYYKILENALKAKWIVVGATLVMAFICFNLLSTLGTEFIPKSDQRQFTLKITMPEGTKLETTSNVSQLIENMVLENSGGTVQSVYSEIGDYSSVGFFSEDTRGPNIALINIRLKNDEDIRVSTVSYVQAIQPLVESIPNIRAEFILEESAIQQTMGGFSGGISIMVKGPELDVLRKLSEEISTVVAEVEGLYNVKTSFQDGRPELDISMRKVVAAGLGLNMNDIINAVKNRLSENVVTEFHYAGNDRDIRVAYPKMDVDELEHIQITTSSGAKVSLKNVTTIKKVFSPKEIMRQNQSRIGIVSADLDEDIKFSDAVVDIMNRVKNIELPKDYSIELAGEEKERQNAFADLKFALILAIVLVYMVLASLFESFIHPFTILLAVPMAGIGSILIFFVLDMPLSIMAFIGIIMLAGIAVNDAIIFVDYISSLRRKGLDRTKAILQAGQDRLRPIMMTSMTTILALFPLIIGVGEGAKLRAPLAYAVIGGLTTSTIMTLIITPCLYLILDNLRPKSVREENLKEVL